jgi:hypothetical protein
LQRDFVVSFFDCSSLFGHQREVESESLHQFGIRATLRLLTINNCVIPPTFQQPFLKGLTTPCLQLVAVILTICRTLKSQTTQTLNNPIYSSKSLKSQPFRSSSIIDWMPWTNIRLGRGVGPQIGEGEAHLRKSCWKKVAGRKKRIWRTKKTGC